MSEISIDVLMRLARTTILLSVAVGALFTVLRFGHLNSARWRRALAVLALLQGVLCFQAPLPVAWYVAVPSTNAVRQPASHEPSAMGERVNAPALPTVLPGAEPVSIQETTPPVLLPPGEEPTPAAPIRWSVWVCGIWLVGIVAIAVVSLACYARFVWRLPAARPIETQWHKEFEDVRSGMNVVGRLRFQVNEALGPLLCWTPRGALLLVPEALWRALSDEQRIAVLRHEVAHYQRRDIVKSLLIRVLALSHWFNPCAWWAVREFEEAGEWICDDLAARNAGTAYAAALVQLCEPLRPIWPTTAARGSGVAKRVRRLLETQTKEDSTMKKLMLAAVAMILLAVGVVRVELVAQPRPEADDTAKNGAARNVELAAKQQAMIEEARRTYEAYNALFEAGTATYEPVYVWSSYIRSSQVRAADSQQRSIVAFREHLERMQELHGKVEALSKQGARGGEAEKLHATQFYVAEAELLLLEAKANGNDEGAPHPPPQPRR